MEADSIELIAQVEEQRTLLFSPGVGWFSQALPAGALLAAGQPAGVLTTLGRRARLLVPEGVRGVLRSRPPELAHAPVQYGQVLYELGPLDIPHHGQAQARAAEHGPSSEWTLRSPQAGRFYHRSAPGEASLCEVGRELEPGTAVGLIEVMKTFSQVVYRAERGLPARAKIARVLARDGGDVEAGAALMLVVPLE